MGRTRILLNTGIRYINFYYTGYIKVKIHGKNFFSEPTYITGTFIFLFTLHSYTDIEAIEISTDNQSSSLTPIIYIYLFFILFYSYMKSTL